MRRLAVAALAATFLAFATTGLRAETSPVEAVRSLQQLQDRIAEGNAIAQAAHAKAIQRTTRAFVNAKLTSWSEPANARALVLYLFSGGNAAAINEVVPAGVVAAEYRTLFTGALAYGLGDDEKARATLKAIDPKSLPSGLGGHLALVQATLVAENDRKGAIALLDLARLLEPGTLIEEAALRKEMSLIGATGDVEKFGFLARRYLGAFSRSVYADNFRQLVAAAAMQIGAGDSDEAAQRLSRLAANLEKGDRRRLYLSIAREAVLAGHTKMAAMAAEEAGRIAPKSSDEEARAMVYLGAATVVGDRYDRGVKALQEVVSTRLGTRDQALRDAAIAVADMIRRPAAADSNGQAAKTYAIADDGERALAKADLLLGAPNE